MNDTPNDNVENRSQKEFSQLTGKESQHKIFADEYEEDSSDQNADHANRNNLAAKPLQEDEQEELQEIHQKHIGNLNLSDLGRFSSTFWIICIFMTTTNPAYFQFINQLNDMIQKKFGVDYSTASQLSMLVPAALMIFVPIFSNLADRYGNKSYYFVVSSIWGLVAFFILNNVHGTKTVAIPTLVNIGVFYSIFSAVIWSGGAQACPPDLVDIGLAIMNTFQSISTFVYPIIFVKFGLTTPQKLFPVLIGIILVGLGASLALVFSKGKRVLVPYKDH